MTTPIHHPSSAMNEDDRKVLVIQLSDIATLLVYPDREFALRGSLSDLINLNSMESDRV